MTIKFLCERGTEVAFIYLFIFWCGPFLKSFIEFVTILLLFYVLVFWPQGMWDLSSPTRDRTRTLCIGRLRLNHWTAREVPEIAFRLQPGCVAYIIELHPTHLQAISIDFSFLGQIFVSHESSIFWKNKGLPLLWPSSISWSNLW